MSYLTATDAVTDLERLQSEIFNSVVGRLNEGETPIVREIHDLPGLWDKIMSCHKDSAGRVTVIFDSGEETDLADLSTESLIEILDALDQKNQNVKTENQ